MFQNAIGPLPRRIEIRLLETPSPLKGLNAGQITAIRSYHVPVFSPFSGLGVSRQGIYSLAARTCSTPPPASSSPLHLGEGPGVRAFITSRPSVPSVDLGFPDREFIPWRRTPKHPFPLTWCVWLPGLHPTQFDHLHHWLAGTPPNPFEYRTSLLASGEKCDPPRQKMPVMHSHLGEGRSGVRLS